MDLARYVVEAVVVAEGRSCREVARAHGVSKSWVAEVVTRYREGGYEAIEPRSKAPKRIPHRTPDSVEDEIVALRKELSELGVDAGAQTIHAHLLRRRDEVPSVSTIWRVLRRRGFVTPQPHKRPRSSWRSFEADLPKECWPSDVTPLAPGRRRRGRDHQRDRRSLAPGGGLPGVRARDRGRGPGGVPGRRCALGAAGGAAHR